MNPKTFATLAVVLTLICRPISFANAQSSTAGYIIPIGGAITQEIIDEIVQLSGKPNPSVLLISHAATATQLERSLPKMIERFKEAGAKTVWLLDTSNINESKQQMEACDILFLSGGAQLRLRDVLEKKDLISALLKRHQKGKLIAGSSAGASIMSDVMMGKSLKDETGTLHPILSKGVPLLPKTIIDQHFSERNRQHRLETAIRLHPELMGVGIDEGTGIVYGMSGYARVIGKGTVTILRIENMDTYPLIIKKEVLKKQDVISLL